MSTQLTTMQALNQTLRSDAVVNNFKQILGQKAQGFITSVLAVANGNKQLQQADPKSIYSAAMVAATLDLPVNPNLGFSALVPYKDSCQFQIMTKGILQLAIRSGQYRTINNATVYDGQLIKQDPFTGEYEFDFSAKKSDNVIGYVAYFKTVTGFEKYLYMTVDEIEKHAKMYSQTYKKGFGVWKDNFEAMALKTVLKLLLSKYGILSIEMQRAITFDQATIKGDIQTIEDIDTVEVSYEDVSQSNSDKAREFIEAEEVK